MINLKSSNWWIVPRHFKMGSIRTVKGLLMPGDWLVKLDLKDAYLSVLIHASHQKFLDSIGKARNGNSRPSHLD